MKARNLITKVSFLKLYISEQEMYAYKKSAFRLLLALFCWYWYFEEISTVQIYGMSKLKVSLKLFSPPIEGPLYFSKHSDDVCTQCIIIPFLEVHSQQ